MVGLILTLLVIFSLRLFWPSTQSDLREHSFNEDTTSKESQQVEILEATTEENDLSSEKLNVVSSDEKTRLMIAEYEILEQERKKLKRHVARLKHDMWGLRFAPEKAKQMSAIVMGASRLLKNPDMLGAFSSVSGIKDEIAKVNFSEKSLKQVNEMIEVNKNSSKNPD